MLSKLKKFLHLEIVCSFYKDPNHNCLPKHFILIQGDIMIFSSSQFCFFLFSSENKKMRKNDKNIFLKLGFCVLLDKNRLYFEIKNLKWKI